jgi:hypothetical protein
MKSSRIVSLAASVLLAFSAVPADAGAVAPPPVSHHSGVGSTFVWVIFGCAGSIIFTAYVAHVRHRRQLTQKEAITCGAAYWMDPHNYR